MTWVPTLYLSRIITLDTPELKRISAHKLEEQQNYKRTADLQTMFPRSGG